MIISSTVKSIFSKSRLLETGYPTVTLGESELYSIFLVICNDLSWDIKSLGLEKFAKKLPENDYYKIPANWFTSHKRVPSIKKLQECLALAYEIDNDFGLYFLNVCSLHKRRL